MSDSFGTLLKRWRHHRRWSQESLAFKATTSTRHLSFLETGKSNPSREMVLALSSALELEFRDRNALLGSAGFAPIYSSNGLESLTMAPVKRAIDLLLAQQEPFGALVVDRLWNVVQVNQGALRMLGHFLPGTPEPSILANVVRATLHPQGLRPAMVNWLEVAVSLLERIEHECAMHPADEERHALRAEMRALPGVAELQTTGGTTAGSPVLLVHLKKGPVEAKLVTLVTTLGTPLDVTAQDLAIESYFPADEATDRWVRSLVPSERQAEAQGLG